MSTARRIFEALLRAIGDAEIDLGQDEMIDEVLATDVAACAAPSVVSAYMLSVPTGRAAAVRSAMDERSIIGNFWGPLQELERAAVEPLPGLDDFVLRWRALLVQKPSGSSYRHGLRSQAMAPRGSEGLRSPSRKRRHAPAPR